MHPGEQERNDNQREKRPPIEPDRHGEKLERQKTSPVRLAREISGTGVCEICEAHDTTDGPGCQKNFECALIHVSELLPPTFAQSLQTSVAACSPQSDSGY